MPKKRILVLMKRFGSNKDMVKGDFGREIRLFENLGKKYDIDFICPDYRLHENFNFRRNYINFYVISVSLYNPFHLINQVHRLVKQKHYDIIIPTSEPLIGIIGYYFAKKYNIPIIYEVQDNYEMYDSYRIPSVRFLDYRVIKNSDYVFYSNYPLMKKYRFLRKSKVVVIENGVDPSVFKIIQRKKARKLLNIDEAIKLVTYTGSISKDRGLDILIDAVAKLRKNDSSIYLLLSGKVDKDININHPFIIYKELPTRKELVLALNASNVLVIASTDNEFTRYCFPQKLFEYMAVNVPIVATAVGDVVRIQKPFKDSLCRPGDSKSLMNKIKLQLKKGRVNYRSASMHYTWQKLSKKLDKLIIACLASR